MSQSVPECDDASPYPDGAAWTALMDLTVAGNVVGDYCGSPSGAFVE